VIDRESNKTFFQNMAKNLTAQQKLKIQVVPKCPDAMECNDVKGLFIIQTLSNLFLAY
jgi:hypothetical protein